MSSRFLQNTAVLPTHSSLRNLSKEQEVHELLQDAIVSGQLKPGQRLICAEIGAQLGISAMPVRNALMRLEAERLVTRVPHREFVVTPYSSKEIRDLFTIRTTLDPLAASLAAERMTSTGVSELREMIERSEQHLANGDMGALESANRQFHIVLYSHAGNEQLLEVIKQLQDRGTRYRNAYYAIPDVPHHTIQEHHEILNALGRGDTELVAALVRTDMETTGRTLLRLAEEEEGSAADTQA